MANCVTVESRKFEVIGTRVFFRSIENSNYREVDIKECNPKTILPVFFSNISFARVKETSQ